MRLPPRLDLLSRHAVTCLAAIAISASPPVGLLPSSPAYAAAAPSAESQLGLRKAFAAAQAGLYTSADDLLSTSIAEWEATRQPADEVAALYKTRGGVRRELGLLPGSLSDLSKALSLMRAGGAPAELQRTYQLRAGVNAALGNVQQQVSDLSSAIALLDELDAIASTNPYLFAERARARMVAGDFAGASEDAETAEVQFKDTGDKIRRTLAAADGALAMYGAGDTDGAVEKMRFIFKTKRTLATTNPDDIALLQELSKRDAELHIAYAAHLYAAQSRLVEANRQWESGCVRLETYVVDGQQRYEAERSLLEREAAQADATGRAADVLRAESGGRKTPFEELDEFRARLNGLDPRSPAVTQRPAQSYFWYKTSEGEVERRDVGNPLRDREADQAIGLSCTAFRDPAWIASNRPEWPRNLAGRMRQFASDVEQPRIPLPPKGSPPTRGEIEF